MNTTTIDIRDYIVDLTAEKMPGVTYEVVLENNTDFIIRRSTAKTHRELVILISQGLYYIKDSKTGTTGVTLGILRTFLKDLPKCIRLTQVYWLPLLSKDCAERIEKIISDDVFSDMCRHNVLPETAELGWYRKFWLQNRKLFLQLHAMFPSITDAWKYQPSFSLIFELEKKFGYNEAIYFATQLLQSGIQKLRFSLYHGYGASKDCSGFMRLAENADYNLQLRRFIDYVLFDLYGQGIVEVDSAFWSQYRDYLELQLNFYGNIHEKYPPSYKTAHDVMTLKVNQSKALTECENFFAEIKRVEHLAHQEGEFCITVPATPNDLAEEGVSLNHCVKSYASRVANGECHILFLRRASTPAQPLVTLQLSGDTLCQAQGYNRSAPTKEERRFLERWGAEKGIRIAV